MNDRYIPCQVLYKNGVACTCWFEDAVSHHGVPTTLFDLFLLVKDKDAAEQVLLAHGWEPAPGRKKDVFAFFSDKVCKPYHRIVRPAQPHLHTFLLNAADWAFPAERLAGGRLDGGDNNPDINTTPTFFPRLAELVDALIDSILDTPDGNRVADHLIMMLAYLYGYVAVLKKDAFAEQLAYEHRQFHYDTKYIHSMTLRFIAHEREVRQQLRDKTLVPHYDPWNNDHECLS